MSTLKGRFISDTGKPIAGVVMDLFTTSDLSGTPSASFQSDDDGTFSFSDPRFDIPTANISVEPFGYYQLVGGPGLFNGDVTLTPTQIVKSINSIPWYAWVAILLVVGYFGYKYYKKQ